MTTYHSRADWGAAPAKPHPHFDPAKVDGVVVHWPGEPLSDLCIAGNEKAVASQLRSEQRFHMQTRGYSDIAYNYAVDAAGGVWTLRGMSVQSGANDEKSDANQRYLAVTFLVGPTTKPSPQMLAAGRDLISVVRHTYPNASVILPHSAVSTDGTACPGQAMRDRLVLLDPQSQPQEPDVQLSDRFPVVTTAGKKAFPKAQSLSVAQSLELAAAYGKLNAVDNSAALAKEIVALLPAGSASSEEIAAAVLVALGKDLTD